MNASSMAAEVYPRPRGGACGNLLQQRDRQGLSPPTRGSHGVDAAAFGNMGSIPAHAGEPLRRSSWPNVSQVYPRPRGGAGSHRESQGGIKGLSPPTRGSRGPRRGTIVGVGSIPAHAGEPPWWSPSPWPSRVYPRPRGGAPPPATNPDFASGLSPPTRGSLSGGSIFERDRGSIPAHAGEPPYDFHDPMNARVYPRPRGGASYGADLATGLSGLSPPTRGSPVRHIGREHQRRSIPAHAGEPQPRNVMHRAPGVYPRPRGGAAQGVFGFLDEGGLSPPTRGSLFMFLFLLLNPGSIPAHAGEPETSRSPAELFRVYPRPRGGAAAASAWASSRAGLSPPTRGSRWTLIPLLRHQRSIPAHAGEPASRSFTSAPFTVYPRPRGGAPSVR